MYVFLRKNHLAAFFLALRQSSGAGGAALVSYYKQECAEMEVGLP
jgi:hypothetical protein